jgi:hypothetical protein
VSATIKKPPVQKGELLREELRALKARGLTFADCVKAWGVDPTAQTYEGALARAAKEQFEQEGHTEFDDSIVVSLGDDPGAYVMAWVWVSDDDLVGKDTRFARRPPTIEMTH